MAARAPRVSTIPAGVSFVDALAHGLLARARDPLELARATVLLPTRRACRALQEAFLRASGGTALLLPRLQPLGDLDAEDPAPFGEEGIAEGAAAAELPPAMPGLRRQLLLATLIRRLGQVRGETPREDQAVRLAEELARLLDQVETEGLDFGRLETLVPEDYAEHWQVTLRFLRIVTAEWPRVQALEGCIGPAERRRRLLELQAEAWRRAPPADPVIVAGSTGSIPATAELMAVVAALPRGEVVLPGLDSDAGDDLWAAIADDPTHPQHGLAQLLARLGVARAAVAPWPETAAAEPLATRGRLVRAALYPAPATPEWRRFAETVDPAEATAALAQVTRIDAPGPGEEARVIALVLRAALEQPGRRAALVTPDRDLARRVAAELGRWGLAVDDSAGTPLALSPPGGFLRLTAELGASALAPLPLLAALKHPLAGGGLSTAEFRVRVRELERCALRGPRPAPGFAGLRRALRAAEQTKHEALGGGAAKRLRAWLRALEASARPFLAALRRAKGLGAQLEAHVGFAEALAATADAEGAARLWAGEAGNAAAEFVAELRQAAADAGPVAGESYPALLGSLLGGRVVRPAYGSHPRLAIWGPLEARLQQVDTAVLGGLNEGTWPAEAEPGPWLGRPMRADFGLPPPERRLGLSAHDVTQLLGAPRVYLTRATRVEGTPTVPSRWLLRLDALLAAFEAPNPLRDEAAQWLAWAEALDRPAHARPAEPPAPRPPRAARPRSLSVTRIETWMRDPYDLYAEQILGLRRLDDLDADPGAAELGILVHEALERFLARYPAALPNDPEAALLEIGRAVFAPDRVKPGVRAFWWPRFRRIARWLAEQERARRPELAAALGEVRGRLVLDGTDDGFTLTAQADRIERLSGGALAIVDYKTGAPPSKTAIELGFAPQLPLEAAIAAAGGFQGLKPAEVAGLAYWRVSGGEPPGEVVELKLDPAAAAAAALEGLRALVARFDDPAVPYPARPRPDWARRYSDYRHLARVKEWGSDAAGEGEA